MIIGIGTYRQSGIRLGRKIEPIADEFEQPRLELAQRRIGRLWLAQQRQCRLVLIEQFRMRIRGASPAAAAAH